MKRLLALLPGLVLGCYFTAANVAGARLHVMRPVTLIGLVLMIAVLSARKRVVGLSAIDKGFLLFMAFNCAAFWVFPQSVALAAADFASGILYVVLLAVVTVPAIFRGSYFTEYFARMTVPKSRWESPVFKTVNRHLTWVWAAIFALSAIVTVIPFLLDMPATLLTGISFHMIAPTLLMLGVGVPFNRIYPRYYKHKLGIEPFTSSEAEAPVRRSATVQQPKEEQMTGQFRVVALNGSPHAAIGNTSWMIGMIGTALAEEGILLEEISLADKTIEFCVGCAVCLEKSGCWRTDDHSGIMDKLLGADGIILGSPVYFHHVTAQMKTFIDRSLSYGHKPRTTWKPGLAVSVSAGRGETDTASYLARTLHAYGAFSVGTLTAIATGPGGFLGKEAVEARAHDLARDLARTIKENRQYPATGEQLSFYLFMKDLVTREQDFMRDDYRYWGETGLTDGFEAYVRQRFTQAGFDPEIRKEWLVNLIGKEKAKGSGNKSGNENAAAMVTPPDTEAGPKSAKSCLELLQIMPLGFRSEASPELAAVFQFEISGPEELVAHLKIAAGRCTFHEGRFGKPDITIKSPADVWLAIARKELSGQSAYMTGKYKVEGNIGLLLKMKDLFAG